MTTKADKNQICKTKFFAIIRCRYNGQMQLIEVETPTKFNSEFPQFTNYRHRTVLLWCE